MKIRLRHLWEVVRSGYWFVPGLMMLIATLIAFALIHLDRLLIDTQNLPSWIYSGGSDGAKTLLSTVAGSVITVAGVVFSITIVALTQASSQFGPRLLRNFMRDTSNQVVLGTFVSTFVYCLLVLRTIHGKLDEGQTFVPQMSVTGAVLLAVASIVVLIYFTHHVSVSLQAPSVIAAIKTNLTNLIDQLARERASEDLPPAGVARVDSLPEDFEKTSWPIVSTGDGYVQAIDYSGLLALAQEKDLVLRLEYRPGDYVIEDSLLLRLWPLDRSTPELARQLHAAFILGNQRTAEQDVEYGIREIVEVAVRALSPGINDPFTAINCIDALASGICRIARIGLPLPTRYDSMGKLRMIVPVSTFEGLADTAFEQIRQYGQTSVAVTVRLLEVFALCGRQVIGADHRLILVRHVESVYRQGYFATADVGDRKDILHRYEAAMLALRRES